MPYIAPNTSVWLFKGIPLDPTYEHTWYFENKDTQFNHFYGYQIDTNVSALVATLNNHTYQHAEDGYIKVQLPMSTCIAVNYMIFKNSSFENKYFSAFVDRVEYINNVTTGIRFHIDEMQTWLCDYTVDQCWVERQHSTSDAIGDNIIEENLATGEFTVGSYLHWGSKSGNASLRSNLIVVATTFSQTAPYENVSGSKWGGIYTGAQLAAYDNVSGLNTLIEAWNSAAKVNEIVAMYMCPEYFWQNTGGTGISGTSETIQRPSTIDGYTPKNNKLFTFPYCFGYVTNNSGDSAVYRFEFSSNKSQIEMGILGSCMPPVTAITYPLNYKGMSACYDEKITLTGFPVCSWNYDAFKAWFAQNAGSIVSRGIGAIISAGAGIASTAMGIATGTGGGFSGFQSIFDMVGEIRDRSVMPPQSCGTLSGNIEFGGGIKSFDYYVKTVKYEYARTIDNFFTKYGYATKIVGIPNRHARSCYTYVKTRGCTISGEVPAESANEIEKVYDKGITFWMPTAVFGDYTQTNSIL